MTSIINMPHGYVKIVFLEWVFIKSALQLLCFMSAIERSSLLSHHSLHLTPYLSSPLFFLCLQSCRRPETSSATAQNFVFFLVVPHSLELSSLLLYLPYHISLYIPIDEPLPSLCIMHECPHSSWRAGVIVESKSFSRIFEIIWFGHIVN